MPKKVSVIGGGFSGLASAAYLAKAGYDVHLFEKNEDVGGRCRVWKQDGFTFDMGPSWYWMPDVFEKFFSDFGHKPSDFYELKRLDPSYRVFFSNDTVDIPANMGELEALFESIEPGAGYKLQAFLKDSQYKYEVGINDLVYKPSLKLGEYADKRVLGGLLKMDLLKSFSKYARKYFKSEKLLQLVEFPILFLGAKPGNTPALYSLMNYADMSLGTWYPMGGMYKIIEGMKSIATENGVSIHTNAAVDKFSHSNKIVDSFLVNSEMHVSDITVSSADYAHTDKLLGKKSNYTENYWEKRTFAPSCLLFYLGINKRVEGLQHHNLFFDEDFGVHAEEIYEDPKWPSKPLFYVCAPSLTDNSVAPEGMENLFMLMPIATNISDSDELREKYFDLLMDRLEKRTGQVLREHIIVKRSYCIKDFKKDYNAFGGNAYGLANTLKQTAILKPKMRHKKLENMYYTGQLTVPGPGVPPSLISGKVVSQLILKNHGL